MVGSRDGAARLIHGDAATVYVAMRISLRLISLGLYDEVLPAELLELVCHGVGALGVMRRLIPNRPE